jgi:hypothetical protein
MMKQCESESVRAEVIAAHETLTSVSLSKFGKKTFDKGADEFQRVCGTHFLSDISHGAYMERSITLKTKSNRTLPVIQPLVVGGTQDELKIFRQELEKLEKLIRSGDFESEPTYSMSPPVKTYQKNDRKGLDFTGSSTLYLNLFLMEDVRNAVLYQEYSPYTAQ